MAIRIKKIEQVAGLIGKVFNSLTIDSDIDAPSINVVKKSFSNPNLLINGDFKVWQRSDTSVNTNNKYTADRWQGQISQNGIVSKHVDGLQITATNTEVNIAQYIELNLSVETVTISFETNEGVFSRTIAPSEQGKWLYIGHYKIYLIYYPDKSSTKFLIGLSNKDVVFKWIKLEQGTVATPFVPKTYGEELAMCRRYYYKGVFTGVFNYDYGDNNYLFELEAPSMRLLQPSVNIVSAYYYANTGLQNGIVSEKFWRSNPSYNYSNDVYYVKVGGYQKLVNSYVCILSIEFDAEIY